MNQTVINSVDIQKLGRDCIEMTDENEQLKEQLSELSKSLVKVMNMVLKMVMVMNRNGLSKEVIDIVEEYI
jgi:hypothetical protein